MEENSGYGTGRARGRHERFQRPGQPFRRGGYQSRPSYGQGSYMRVTPYPSPYYQNPSQSSYDAWQSSQQVEGSSVDAVGAYQPTTDEGFAEKGLEVREELKKVIGRLQMVARGRKGFLSGMDPEPAYKSKVVKQKGTLGTVMPLQTNLFRFETVSHFAFQQYHVRFEPEVPSSRFSRLLMRQVETGIGVSNYVTDGVSLFTTQMLDAERLENLTASTKTKAFKITMTHVATIPAGSQMVLQLLNVIFNSIVQDYYDLKWMNRNYYDVKNPCQIQGTSYSLYSGFVSSIIEFEHGTRLMMDISHKLIATESVLEMINTRDLRSMRTHIVGQIVHTRYNDRTYKVEDIDFDKTPNYTFMLRNKEVSVAEYYKMKYNIDVRNSAQPLLSVKPKKKDLRAGAPEVIYLVPELCHITGFTDEVRSNSQVMRKFSQQTKLEPQQRLQKMNNFVRQIAGNPEVKKVLDNFSIVMSKESIQTEARKLPKMPFIPRELHAATRGRLLDPAHLRRWKFVYPVFLEADVVPFLMEFSRVCRDMGMICEQPEMMIYRNDMELQELVKNCPLDAEMLMAVIRPDERKYAVIKKMLCLQLSVPSQVVLCHNVTQRKHPILAKMALQMTCKMGGAGWSIANMSLGRTLLVGIDIYRDSQKYNCTYVGVVASLDIHCSKYYTTWQRLDVGRDVIVNLRSLLLECMKEYHIHNNQPCQRVIVYRDGVSDGMLSKVVATEVKEALGAIEDARLNTKLAYIVVKKRINSRFFVRENNTYVNPPPGTVVDMEATRSNWADFYLINQEVRGGSVTPTHFNVLYNDTDFQMDDLQMLTYQQCHLYYNWTGPIRVPAVCQYAHKAAFMTAQYLHEYPNPLLKRKLFYL